MADKRKVEIFSAGCPVGKKLEAQVRAEACPSCGIVVGDMNDADVAARAAGLGVTSVPAVAIDGKLAACCEAGGPDMEVLRAAGLGQPIA